MKKSYLYFEKKFKCVTLHYKYSTLNMIHMNSDDVAVE